MTFDARKTGGAAGLTGSNLVFGGITLAVVGGVFLAGLMLFDGDKAPRQHKVVSAHISSVDASPTFSTPAARRYFKALNELDAGEHGKLMSRLDKASGKSSTRQFEIVSEHLADLVRAHARDITAADARHADRLLNLARVNLKKASNSNSQWCRGSNYAGMQNMTPAKAKSFQKDILALEGPIQDFMFDAYALMLDAAKDGRENPVRHGKLTQSDEMAMQGVMMSMMSDPQVMPLVMAAQTGQNSEDVMAQLNVCELGATAMTALKTLPQDTKGRVWARSVREFGKGFDSTYMKGLGG